MANAAMRQEMPLTSSSPRIAHTLTGATTGPVVCFVPGFGMPRQAWQAQVAALQRTHRILSYDHRGTGMSEVADVPTTMADIVGDLERLLDHAGIESCRLVALSFGGRVAQAFAARHPSRVERLVLVSSARHHDERAPTSQALDDLASLDAVTWRAELAPLLFGTRFLAQEARRVHVLSLGQTRRPPDPAGLRRLREADLSFQPPRPGDLGMPTLVIHGSDDRLVPLAAARRLAEGIPGSRLEILDETGHSPHLESPAELNTLLTDFLR